MRLRIVAALLAWIASATAACGALLPSGDDDPAAPSPDSGSDAAGDVVATADGAVLAPVDPTAEPPDAAIDDAAADADANKPLGLTWECIFEPSPTYSGLTECEAKRSEVCEAVPDGGSSGQCANPGDTVTTCTACSTLYRFYTKTCTCH